MTSMTDLQFYFIIFFLCLISALLLHFISIKPISHLHLPPSPPAVPVIGHLHYFFHLFTPLHKLFQNLSSSHGPLLYLRLGANPCVLVSSASFATQVFKTNDLAFAARPVFAFADRLPYGTADFVTAPYGDYWRFMKKLCMTELLGAKQVESFSGVRREEICRVLRKMIICAARNESVDVGFELMKFSNNATCRMVMNTKCSEEDGEAERLRQLLKKSFELAPKICFGEMLGPFKKLGFWMYGKQVIELMMKYDELLEKIMKEHEETREKKNGVEHKDLMDILLDFYEDNDKSEFRITRTQIKAFIAELFIAGTSTSAEAMQWTMAELINHPDVLKKVRDEINSVTTTSDRLVEESDICKLPYLQAVVKESLRLHPSVPLITRECRTKNCRIKEFDIPEKTTVAINLYAVMRDPDEWGRPNEFLPERFLHFSIEKNNEINQYDQSIGSDDYNKGSKVLDFVPFGGGRRVCPGSTLAFSMINIAVASLVQCFDWDQVGEVKMEEGSGMKLAMVHPLVCTPVVHFNPFVS